MQFLRRFAADKAFELTTLERQEVAVDGGG
jgi:hypothetical protein